MKYLFVFGCPRSGTTVLSRVLGSHPRIVLGIERFGKVFFRQGLEPSLFQKERFFDIRPEDTHYRDFKFKEYHVDEEALRARYEFAEYIGDKIPSLFRKLNVLDAFPKEQLFLISVVRNAWDVCASYEKRKSNVLDEWSKDALEGVRDWNLALKGIQEIEALGYAHVIVDYDALFTPLQSERELLERIEALFHKLGLEWQEEVSKQVQTERKQVLTLEQRRVQEALPLASRLAISRRANFGLYRSLLKSRACLV